MSKPQKSTTHHYFYDQDHNPMFRAVIRPKKDDTYTYIQHKAKDGTWHMGAGNPLFYPIYNLPHIIKNPEETIYFVENERIADALIEHDLLATTFVANQTKVRSEYLGQLAGRDLVFVLSKPTNELVERFKTIARGLLFAPEDALGDGSRPKRLSWLELWYPEYMMESRDVPCVSEWIGRWGTKENFLDFAEKARELSLKDLADTPDELLEEIQGELLEDVRSIDIRERESYLNLLRKVEPYWTLGQREFMAKQLAMKFGINWTTIVKDYENHIGEFAPIKTAYFPGVVDLVAEWGDQRYFVVAGEEGLEVVSHYFSDGKSYIADSGELRIFLEEGLMPAIEEAKAERRYADWDTVPERFIPDDRNPIWGVRWPSVLERQLFSDLKAFVQRLGIPEHLADIVTYLIFGTWMHDHEDIKSLPYLGLQFPNARSLDKFSVDGLMDIVFRGFEQISINESHILRFTNSYAATLIFRIADPKRTIFRNNVYDLFCCRYRRDRGRAYRIRYTESRERLEGYHVYGPTIFLQQKPFEDDFLKCITVPVEMPDTSDLDVVRERDSNNLCLRLTAWRALNLSDSIPKVDGFRPEMKTLGLICRLVNPEGLDTLLEQIERIIPPVKTSDEMARENLLREIVEFLADHFPKHGVYSWEYGTATEVAELLGKGLQQKFTGQQVGVLLKKELGLSTTKTRRGNVVRIHREDLQHLMKRYSVKVHLYDKFEADTLLLTELIGKN